jgi:hypothetical protein
MIRHGSEKGEYKNLNLARRGKAGFGMAGKLIKRFKKDKGEKMEARNI